MCLSIAVDFPHHVLATGEYQGFQWVVVHNGIGYRCGYVRVPAGHPWHSKEYDDIAADVHGGLTFAELDKPCGKGEPDDAYWLGFDFAHGGDSPDRALPADRYLNPMEEFSISFGTAFGLVGKREYDHIWTQDEVEAECRSLCEQAAEAAVVTVG